MFVAIPIFYSDIDEHIILWAWKFPLNLGAQNFRKTLLNLLGFTSEIYYSQTKALILQDPLIKKGIIRESSTLPGHLHIFNTQHTYRDRRPVLIKAKSVIITKFSTECGRSLMGKSTIVKTFTSYFATKIQFRTAFSIRINRAFKVKQTVVR